ncbi:1,3-beta-galactosyl-N-acetylhexosamine phosphorylase C-terminal domain-containing protein [Tessaracoccus flavus]|uniref:1,3-beta-galactosyl-N-acetylhexosamine phosphorylase C-terminal domain-containing protein n=1 Tax=Tessaracoccus flavus TaxID=1610493 RepID=UPI0013901FC1|nr:1,3-beta-galactosyl-N-acetylhexosamine phosphorylase C-terminal domain-containing protein [Tessaracoccus flavus]
MSIRSVGSSEVALYIAGLPYSADNARLLHRAIYWAAGREEGFDGHWNSSNPAVEVAVFPEAGKAFVMNTTTEPVTTTVRGRAAGLVSEGEVRELQFDLAPAQSQWVDLA